MISSTSSNTTSGIVSDRVHSEDELEIMITSPPAPSTESLALAHLLDSAPASSRTSAASAAAAAATVLSTALAIKEETTSTSLDDVAVASSRTTDGGDGSSSATVKTVKCAGSQCSSSCSTVVVTPVHSSK